MNYMEKSKEELINELHLLQKENEYLKVTYKKSITEVKQAESKLMHSGLKSLNDMQSARKLFDEYIRMYSSRDDQLTTFFSDDFSGFTGGGDFLVKDKEEWIAITRQDFAQVKDPIRIEIKDVAIQSLADTIVVATGFFKIHLPIKDHILSRETARLVLIFRKEEAGWKISHSSISIPYYLVREGEVYPLKELVDRNQFLEKMVAERTIQLSEANDNLQKANENLKREIAEHKQADKARWETEQKYHLLVDSAKEAIVVVQDGLLRLTNPMTRTMIGYSAKEIEEIPFSLFVHPEDRDLVVDNYQRRLRGEDVPRYYIFRLLNKNGTTRWVYMNGVLIDWEGRPATLNFLTDITELKHAENALQHSNQKLEAIISATPDGIGVISLDGKMTFISKKLAEMNGYSTEEIENLIGRQVSDFIDPSNHQMLADNIRKLLDGKSYDRLTEYLAVKKDNSRFYIDVNSTFLYDSNGNPESILFVERDITERKKAEEALMLSNQKLEAVISATPDGIGMISLDGNIQLIMSNKLAEMHGYTIEQKEEFVGRSVFDFIDPSFHKILIDNIRKLFADENDDRLTEYMAIKKDNSRFYIEVRSTILKDSNDNPANILFVERDITERKHSEEVIKQKNLELAELNATKDKFFSIIAHDLRSPFQGLLGYSQILSSKFSTLSEEEKISFIGSIEILSQSSYKLLENLLDWSRIQTGQMQLILEKFNLLAELYPTLSLVRQTAMNKGIEFDYAIDNSIFIKADKNMLFTIIRNLISNSIKFTNNGGRINLTARILDNSIEFSVTDTGVGIEKENLNKLFKIDDNIRRKGTANEEGSGLGLLLCKEMVEKHSGEIKVKSEVGKGTTFLFTFGW